MSIGLVGGSSFLTRASSPSILADYTAIGLVYLNLSGGGNQPIVTLSELGIGTGHRDQILWNFGSDTLDLNSVGGTGAPGAVGGGATVTYDGWMKVALRRSGGTLSVWYADVGSALVQQVSAAAGTTGRNDAALIGLGNDSGGGAIRVEAWRVYAGRALTNAEMDAELAFWPNQDTTGQWAGWRLQTAGTYTDVTGNSRPVTATGTPTTEADQSLTEPSNISAAVSGTGASGMTEADVRAGGKTIVIDIIGSTWVPS